MKTRRAVFWRDAGRPGLSALFGDAAARKHFFTYWTGDVFLEFVDYALFPLFARIPAHIASAIGGFIGGNFAMLFYPAFTARIRGNIARIRPDLDEAAREKLLRAYFANRGRVMAEYPGMPRQARLGRISVAGVPEGEAEHAKGKGLILIGLHLANWEAALEARSRSSLPVRLFYQPPARASQHHLAMKMRRSMDVEFLKPGAAGALPALRFLKGGGILAMFGDEQHMGRMMAPFFGRAPHLDGNLAIIARLARMTGAGVMVFHSRRVPGGHAVTFEKPVALPSRSDPKAELIDDVAALNAAIEPLILERLEEWYFLSAPFS